MKPGDFVMVLGYPGTHVPLDDRCARWITKSRRFELVRKVYGEWIHGIEEAVKGNAEGSIAVAAGIEEPQQYSHQRRRTARGIGARRV